MKYSMDFTLDTSKVDAKIEKAEFERLCGKNHFDMNPFSDVIDEINKKLYFKPIPIVVERGPHTIIDRVIINDPATIIIWMDGTKTVVKCMEGEKFDPEKGIAMAFMKRVMFNDKSTPMHKWIRSRIPAKEVLE